MSSGFVLFVFLQILPISETMQCLSFSVWLSLPGPSSESCGHLWREVGKEEGVSKPEPGFVLDRIRVLREKRQG